MCKVTISAVIWHYISENCHTRYFRFIQNTLYLIATYVCVEVWQAKIHDHVLQPERKKIHAFKVRYKKALLQVKEEVH